jgi:CBS domain containing-hemolysin-like protein
MVAPVPKEGFTPTDAERLVAILLIALGLLMILALTAATGYFVTQEFGYVAVDRGQLTRAARAGDRRAARALRITQRLSFVLSGAQLGITITALLVGYVAEPYLGTGLATLLGSAGVSTALASGIAVALALAVSTVVQMVLGELAPKNLALARSHGVARTLANSTTVYLTVAAPLIKVFDAAANRILRRVGVEPAEELPVGATPEDLEHIVARGQASGDIDQQLSILLDRGLDFRRYTALEAMTPRVDVVTIGGHEPCSRVVDLLATGHSRFPVAGASGIDDIDDIVGIVSITDLLDVPADQRTHQPVSTIATTPIVIPAGNSLRQVLDELRTHHRQMALVVDEYGGFAGVITLEDIAEELVGPILDEDDLPEPGPAYQSDGSWLVPGRWRIDEIADATGLRLPSAEGYDTLSGLLLSLLGRVPAVGDELHLPSATTYDTAQPSIVARVETVRRSVADTVLLRQRDPS